MPTERVKGRVAWLNRSASVKELASQLGLEKGHVVMLPFLKDLRKGRIVFVKKEPASSRSLLLQQRYWREPRTKRLFRDFDAKGVGHTIFEKGMGKIGPITLTRGGGFHGLADIGIIKYDARLALKFHAAGARVAIPIAVVKLEDVKKVVPMIFKVRNYGNRTCFYPGVLIRIMSVKTRIKDIMQLDEEKARVVLNDAKRVVAKERGKKRVFTDEEYVRWFAAELGKSLGIMHAQGYLHRGINTHNVTLAAELVDLGDVKKVERDNKQAFITELRMAEDIISQLARKVLGADTNTKKIKEILRSAYASYMQI
jgi:tRNA A-37 threonylcarbamoyl transferase component Bud32